MWLDMNSVTEFHWVWLISNVHCYFQCVSTPASTCVLVCIFVCSLIPALILEGGVSTATATLTVLSDSSLQSPTLALLKTIVTSEE